jgi:hypothetical protein
MKFVAGNALHALFASLVASAPTTVKPQRRSRNRLGETVRLSDPRIDARKARRSGETTHRQQKLRRMELAGNRAPWKSEG